MDEHYFRTIGRVLFSALRNKLAGDRARTVVGGVKEAVCEFQGRFPGNQYRIARRHAELKDLLQADSPLEKIRKTCDALDSLTFNSIVEANGIARIGLDAYYSELRRTKDLYPRVCLKTLIGNDVIDLVRRQPNEPPREWKVSDYQENTGFVEVFDSARVYCENDIPTAAKNNAYKNPRLNLVQVATYKESLAYKRPWWVFRDNPFVDRSWAQCWSDWNNEGVDYLSHYKSTMILPITLKPNAVPEEFRRKLAPEAVEVSRLNLGFLCLDHLQCHFFDPDVDSILAWIYSDMLSLPILMRYAYVTTSVAYKDAKIKLAENSD